LIAIKFGVDHANVGQGAPVLWGILDEGGASAAFDPHQRRATGRPLA